MSAKNRIFRWWALPLCLWLAETGAICALPVGIGIKILLAVTGLVFMFGLFVTAVLDWRLRIVPDAVTFPGTLAALASAWLAPEWHPAGGIVSALFGLAVCIILMTALRWLGGLLLRRRLKELRAESPEIDGALGWGDVKLLGWLGAMLGWRGGVLALGLAAATGSGVGLAMGWRVVPLGAFLCLTGYWIFVAEIILIW